jgi:hypothetical protein
MDSTSGARRWLRIESSDAHTVLTRLCGALLVAAAVLAVVGIPPVDAHSILHRLGIMDPLCGGTRATYLAMRGHLGEALRYNPAAPPLLAAAAAVMARAAAGKITGRWVSVSVPRRAWLPAVGAALVALAVNQQLNADLLTSPWPR